MGFLDRLFGTEDSGQQRPPAAPGGYADSGAPTTRPPRSEDELAVERYRYLLRTAPPETIEQVHAEAFGKLTETQRQQVLAELSAGLPAAERPSSTDPNALARAATRAEYTNPGFMERTLGDRGGNRQGPSFGSMVGGSLLGTVAGYVIGSALVGAFMAPAFADSGSDGSDGSGGESGGGDAVSDAGAASADTGGFGDAGGGFDFGGGDFGGGDFGGF